MSKEFVLAGDIGGTNARLRVYDLAGEAIECEATLPSGRYPSLTAVLAPFVEKLGAPVRAAAFGIAGPVVDGVSRTTNLPWVVDEKALSRDLGIPSVLIVNDLAAVAIGCTRAAPAMRRTIAAGDPPRAANMAVIAAGTGLGEALLIWDGQEHLPCSTEGGHADFAPRSPVQMDLLAHLASFANHDAPGHVSYERVLSGPGLGCLYDFLVARGGKSEPEDVASELARGDRNAAITRLGLAGKSAFAAQAVDIFADAYGAEAGNLVLKGLGIGGLFLCGRIASDIVPAKKEIFLHAMRDKGRMQPLMERVPVTIVEDDLIGLAGAGYLAARLA